jgi:hypothetical protein
VPSDALLPVSGDPYAVASAARTLESVAAEVAATSAKLRAVSVGSWTGVAASRAHQRTVSLPPKLEKLRVSYATAATALGGYASALAQAKDESAAAVRAAETAAADLAAAGALAAAAAASASPSAPRYDGEIADAESRLARATAANAAAHDAQRSAARVAAAGLRQASHQGIRNQPWWRHAAGAVAHWASSTWATSLRLVSKVATTVSALAGLAALVVSVAGIFFPPLEAAAAVLETISLVSGIAGTIADTALAATGRASWTVVGFDALGLAPWAGSKLVRKAGRLIRNPRTVVFASTGRREGAELAALDPVAGSRQQVVQLLADSYRPPGSKDPLTVAVLQTKSGALYAGRSGFRRAVDPRVRAALDSVPEAVRPAFHGRCAEIDCLNQAIADGGDVTSSVVSTARVRGLASAAHGTPIQPCRSCEWVLKQLGGLYEP